MVFKLKRKIKLPATPNERLEHQRLTSLVNSMADAVIAVDEDIKVVLYNAAALNIFDVNTIEAGTDLGNLFRLVDRDNQPQNITTMVRQTRMPATTRELRLRYADGSQINLYLSIAPVKLGYGERGQHGYVLLLRDITHEKSLEEERDEFISVVSHELRTPIAIAEGNVSNAELLVNQSADIEKVKQALKEAHDQVLFLSDMVNDLATLSRAERGRLKVEITAINVPELINELMSNYTPQAEAKGLKLAAEIDPSVGELQSSRLYVHEILQNFITNAIKYTEHGQVTIQATADPKGVRFAVRDTGIGIGKGDQEHVFDKFFRAEDFRTRKASGTGLGLYVTIKLVNLIHGEADVESKLNEGSVFTVFIPHLQ